mmetsp:Transcript_12553/g.29979  ORF Transcript_12553/g.29979 Transcript_12553/m.29979 type:complete len:83 (-) Transcript_12553:217-465(-)
MLERTGARTVGEFLPQLENLESLACDELGYDAVAVFIEAFSAPSNALEVLNGNEILESVGADEALIVKSDFPILKAAPQSGS